MICLSRYNEKDLSLACYIVRRIVKKEEIESNESNKILCLILLSF